MNEYGQSYDLGGGELAFEAPSRATWITPGVQTVEDAPSAPSAAAVAAVIPQMSRPYQGVWPITQFFNPPAHRGLDVGMPLSTNNYSPFYGQVVWAGWDATGYGNMVGVKNDAIGIYVILGHLSYVGVRVGQWVNEREFVGRSGSTGNSTGPHLHVELRVKPYNWQRDCIDPLRYMQVWDSTPPPPTPTPTPTGTRWRTTKAVSVYAAASMGAPVVGHLAKGAIVTATVYPDADPLRDWLMIAPRQYIMRRNKAKTLAVQA